MSDSLKPGHADVLVGLQYGDEGKAKVIDIIGDRYDIIARFNGGANAGHTIETSKGPLALRQVPSGVLLDKCTLYIGSGCTVNLGMLVDEINMINRLGIDLTGRLFISSRAAVIQPHHLEVDRLNSGHIGTTMNGIGPCYADRALRMVDDRRVSISVGDFLRDSESAIAAVSANAVAYGNASHLTDRVEQIKAAVSQIKPYILDDDLYMVRRVQAGANVLFEGAQSVELDVAKGSVPFVTSSHTIPGFAYVGGDLPPKYHRYTIGVAKAIVSRVGKGPMPCELGGEQSATYCAAASLTTGTREREKKEYDPKALLASSDPFDVGMALRILTGEYGTGTGRPRRIGMFDLAQLRDSVALNGVDMVFINKCDCLGLYALTQQGTIPVVTSYGDHQKKVLNIKGFAAFEADTSAARQFSDLPNQLRDLMSFTEEALGCPLLGIGLGPSRNRNVVRLDLLDGSRPTP